MLAEVSLMRIGSRIKDVTFGVLAQIAGSYGSCESLRGGLQCF